VDQQRVLRTGCLVTGVHTPPIRRNSKLATLGRIFKPWKWRKKKNEKLKQSSTGMGRTGVWVEGLQDMGEQMEERSEEEILPGTSPPQVPPKLLPQLNSGPVSLPAHLPNSYLPKEPLPRATESLASMTLPLRGPLANSSGSPHLGNMIHPPMPPSCIMEELQRAFASKNRQESVHEGCEQGSPPRLWCSDGRLSRSCSSENQHTLSLGGICVGIGGSDWPKKEAEENKENVRLDQCFSNTSGLPTDLDGWNESVISGTLPRRLRKELLAFKLRNRPSKQELEDRNIFPARSDQERQEIRQQIEMKLAKRLSQRPNVEELESRNILKQRNDQTEQEERREIKQRLNRKLNQRPTVDELRDRKILIRFSDYVEVAKAQDYDRRADKPWTRLSAADKAAIRKELNEFKSTEMEVHASSKHLTRFHRP
uniref:Phosphatase and actin regulator n=1 Tax=Amphilophus citrinellus TaxID=61819 RepID=A0A3Q0SXK4_AMPCI